MRDVETKTKLNKRIPLNAISKKYRKHELGQILKSSDQTYDTLKCRKANQKKKQISNATKIPANKC